MRIPTYISRTAPGVVGREGVSPEQTGLPVARGLSTVAGALAEVELEAEKRVGDVARMADFVSRKDRISSRLADLDVSLSEDPDHRTYFDRAKKAVEEISREALEGISDPALKNALTLHVSGERQQYLTNAKHKARGLTVDYSRGILEESIDRKVMEASAATDADVFGRALGDIDAAVTGAVEGGIWSREQGGKIGRTARERIYTAQAMQLADQEPGRFLENHKEGLYTGHVDPLRLEEIRRHAEGRKKQLEPGEDAQASGLAAEEIWSRMGPVSDLTPVNLDVMEAEAGKLFVGDQDRAKLARAVLREKTAAHDKGVAERRDANLGTIWGAYAAGATIDQILSTPEYRRLSGTDQADVKSKILDRARALSREEKQASQERWDAAYYEISSDPDALAALSDDQVKALYPEVGPTNWKRLVSEKKALSSPEVLAEAKIDTDLFKSLAAKAGYDIAPRTEKKKQKLAELKTQLLDALVAVQKDAGRKLRPDEKKKVLTQLVTRVPVREQRTLLGIPLGDTTTEKPLLSVEYKGNIVVPPADRKMIVERYRAQHGRDPSENQIIDAFIALSEEE